MIENIPFSSARALNVLCDVMSVCLVYFVLCRFYNAQRRAATHGHTHTHTIGCSSVRLFLRCIRASSLVYAHILYFVSYVCRCVYAEFIQHRATVLG